MSVLTMNFSKGMKKSFEVVNVAGEQVIGKHENYVLMFLMGNQKSPIPSIEYIEIGLFNIVISVALKIHLPDAPSN